MNLNIPRCVDGALYPQLSRQLLHLLQSPGRCHCQQYLGRGVRPMVMWRSSSNQLWSLSSCWSHHRGRAKHGAAVTRREVVEDHDTLAALDELADRVAADVTGTAGDEDGSR